MTIGNDTTDDLGELGLKKVAQSLCAYARSSFTLQSTSFYEWLFKHKSLANNSFGNVNCTNLLRDAAAFMSKELQEITISTYYVHVENVTLNISLEQVYLVKNTAIDSHIL